MDLFVERSSVSFAEVEHFTELFSDYCAGSGTLFDHFPGDFRSESDYASIARNVSEASHDRELLSQILYRQNSKWHEASVVEKQAARLRHPNSLAVVTGQQLGLFGGPLYTLYKAVTAVKLAARLETLLERPVVPLFWLEGEDHDLQEAGQVSLLNRNEPLTLRYPGAEMNRTSVGRLVVSNDIVDIRDGLHEALPPSDFRADVLNLAHSCYDEGVTFYDAFARFLAALFGDSGLLFVRPDDPDLKAMAVSLFVREVKDFEHSHSLLLKAGDVLEKRYHAQVRSAPLGLFLYEGDERKSLDARGGSITVRDSDRRFSRDDLVALVQSAPETISPNVVLRPLYQDTVLPTVAYVAGPGEVAYFAQFSPLYRWAGVSMPMIYPRLSASLVEGKVRKVLEKYDLSVPDLGSGVETLFRRVVEKEMSVDLKKIAQDVRTDIEDAIRPLADAARAVDPGLNGAAAAFGKSLEKEIGKFQGKVLKSEKKKHDLIDAQLDKAANNLYPYGKPQERIFSIMQYLVRYGTGFVRQLLRDVPDDTSRHHILHI